jgi:hypothetical protein
LADKKRELQDKIKMLQDADPDSPKLAQYRRELASIEGGKAGVADDVLELDINEADWEEVRGGSNRPPAGEYLAEMQVPIMHYSDKASKFPFVIIQPGPWKSYEDAFYPATGKDALFRIKNLATSCGVKPVVNERTGKLGIPFGDFPGKKFIAVYENQESLFTGTDNIERNVTVSKVKKARAAVAGNLKI